MGDPFTVYEEGGGTAKALHRWMSVSILVILLAVTLNVILTPRPTVTSYPVTLAVPGTAYVQTAAGQLAVRIPQQLRGTPVRILMRQQNARGCAIPSWVYVVVTDTGDRYTIGNCRLGD